MNLFRGFAITGGGTTPSLTPALSQLVKGTAPACPRSPGVHRVRRVSISRLVWSGRPAYSLGMQLVEVLDLLRALPRADKLRAVQYLASELAQEEAGALWPQAEYPVWSPHDAHEAAATLTQFLHEQTRGA